MLKSAMIYKMQPHSRSLELHECEQALQAAQYVPLQGAAEKAVGFVPPRGQAHGALAESVGDHWFFRVAMETKKVPGSVVREKLDAKIEEIERATGRKPGKQERRELSEDIFHALLPNAFPVRADTNVWVDRTRQLLILDATSQSKADEVVSLLVNAIGIQISFVQTQTSPMSAMTQWLMADQADDSGPNSFDLGKELVLKADEEKAQVKYSHHFLDNDGIRPEIKKHIAQGKRPRSLELCHEKGVSFVMTENLNLKKITFSDVDPSSANEDGNADPFDANVVLTTSILGAVVDDLFCELGGEMPAGN
jgi:recombination associated protein RdgC